MVRHGIAVCAVSLCAACSLGMQTLPRNWNPQFEPHCSDSAAAPALDITAGLGVMTLALMAAAVESSLSCGFTSGQENCGESESGRMVAIGALMAAPFVVSGVYGLRKGNQCDRAMREHRQYLAEQLIRPRATMAPVIDRPGPPAPAETAAPGQTTPVSPECDPVIAEYQATADPARQAILYRDMPAICRKRISRSVTEREYKRELERAPHP